MVSSTLCLHSSHCFFVTRHISSHLFTASCHSLAILCTLRHSSHLFFFTSLALTPLFRTLRRCKLIARREVSDVAPRHSDLSHVKDLEFQGSQKSQFQYVSRKYHFERFEVWMKKRFSHDTAPLVLTAAVQDGEGHFSHQRCMMSHVFGSMKVTSSEFFRYPCSLDFRSDCQHVSAWLCSRLSRSIWSSLKLRSGGFC